MAKIGINTFLWTSRWETGVFGILERARRFGFQAVQIPLLGRGLIQARELKRVISDLGLDCFISAGLKDATDVTSEDRSVRRAGIDFLKDCAEFAHEVGSPFLSGSFHSVFGKKSSGPVTERQWTSSAEALREVASAVNPFRLVLEPINRYESYLVNTAAQARRLIELSGAANVKVQLDTFHMNIEEEGFRSAIESLGSEMVHFHVAESHRGPFGTGTIPWDEVFSALADIRYAGAIVVESFTPDVPEVAVAAAIWRRMVESADAFAGESFTFIRRLAQGHGL